MSLTIVIPATGRYFILGRRLARQLLRQCSAPENLRVVIGTDHAAPGEPGVDVVHWPKEPWPRACYAKFGIGLLAPVETTHAFLMDADTSLMPGRWSTTFLERGDLVCQEHTDFPADITQDDHPFETDPNSTAYLPPEERMRPYSDAWLMGGTTSEFKRFCMELKRRADIDLAAGIVNRFHDESHWNKWLSENPHATIPFREAARHFRINDKAFLPPEWLRDVTPA